MVTLQAVLTLFLCLKTAASHDILLTENVQDPCLTTVLLERTKFDETFAITWSHRIDDATKDDISKLFTEKVKFILKDNPTETVSNLTRKPGTTLIVASTMTDIVEGISSLCSTHTWCVTSKFIVVYLENYSNNRRLQPNDTFLKDVFQTFANLNALNVRLIYKFDEDKIDEFSWFPYEDGNCGTVNRVKLISKCGFVNNQILQNNKNTENLQRKCTITAAVRSLAPFSSSDLAFSKRFEVDLVRKLAQLYHFDVSFQAIENGKHNDKSFDLIFGDVANDVQGTLMQSIDFYFDDLTWCVKGADLLRPWRSFFLIGTWRVWTIAVIGVYVIGATLFLFYGHYHHQENYHYCTGITMLTLFAISVPYNPTHGIARIHFGFLLIYGLLAVIFISCYLTSMMTKPQYQQQIHTIDDLMYYEYKILVDVQFVSLLMLGNDKVSQYVKANHEHCNGMVNCLNQLFERPKMVVIIPRKFALHFDTMTKLSTFCFASSESFNRFTRCFNMSQSNSYLLNITNLFIRRAMETGHLLKWEDVGSGRDKFKTEWNGPLVLTVEHLSGGLVVYVCSASLALLCFIGEQLAFKSLARGNNRVWKWVDKFVLSTERLVCRRQLQLDDSFEVEVNSDSEV